MYAGANCGQHLVRRPNSTHHQPFPINETLILCKLNGDNFRVHPGKNNAGQSGELVLGFWSAWIDDFNKDSAKPGTLEVTAVGNVRILPGARAAHDLQWVSMLSHVIAKTGRHTTW